MPDDKATKLWDALRRGVYRSEAPDVALDGYPKLLKALEEGCQGHSPTESPKCLYCQALADARAALLEAQNAE